jgi:hypothetical protein
MRRYENKLKRSKEMAQRHLAPEKNIKKRAMSAARGLLRTRVAGQRGAEYAQMGPSEKMAIDRLIDGKTKVVKKIALRLIPKIRQKEHMRLASFMKGAALENQGTPSPKTPTMESVDGKVNKKFADKFAVGATEKKEVKLYPKEDIKSVVKFHNKFSEEASIRSDTFKGLCKKAEKSGIDLDVLGEVYDRGMDAWTESMSVSQQQYAFARVNSFINQGKSYFNEDADLQEAAEYRIRETNPGGLHTRHSVQRVKKGSNQPVGQPTIYDKRADAENHVEKSGGRLREDAINEAKPNSQYQEWPGQGPKRAFGGQFGYQDNGGRRLAAGEVDAKLDSRGRYTKDSVRKMFGGKLSPDAEGIKEETLTEANRLKYDASGKQWYHSANGGFTWKRVTSDEAKKAYPGKHKDITAEHDLKEGASKVDPTDQYRRAYWPGKDHSFGDTHNHFKGPNDTWVHVRMGGGSYIHRDAAGKTTRFDDFDSLKKHLGKINEGTIDEMKTVTNRSHGKSYHIEVNGSKNLCKQYSFGHYPFMGPLNKTCHATKTELKKALQAHPYYNTSLRENTLDEMSWTKQVQYADAAKKDRLDKFNKSLQTKDPVEKAALIKRIDNRSKTIQKVMDRSGWNRKPVKEEVFTSDKQPVIVPAIRNADGTSQPAKTVMRRVRKKILGTGNVHDGK